MTNKKVFIETIYCGSWFNGLIIQLQEHVFDKFGTSRIEFINYPQKVEKDQPKPYVIKINGETIYSITEPVNGEKVPIIFKDHKYFGKPNNNIIEYLDQKINNVLEVPESNEACEHW